MDRLKRSAAGGGFGLAVLAVLVALAGCGSDDDGGLVVEREREAAAEAAADAETAPGDLSLEDGDWGTFGGSYEQTRHSPLTQITPDNVERLGRAFSVDFLERAPSTPPQNQTYPVVVDGVIYATTSFNHIFAIDGASGEVLWHFETPGTAHFSNFGLSPNRGVAYCEGRVFMLTLDMRIVSVDADTGRLVEQVDISDAVEGARPQLGFFNTAAPVCYKGLLFVGTSGSDYGVRGFVMAYRADDLSPAWANPYWTIPPEGQDWRAAGRFHGGGSVASAVTVDPETDIVYVPVGVPSPVYFAELRPGPNPKTNSLIALDAFTGEELWWRQQLAEDEWNYDTFASPLVFDAEIDGETRRVVTVATKQGYLFTYDADTGEEIHERVQLLDRIEHPELRPGEGVRIFPSGLGGVNYTGSSFDPEANYEIVGTAETSAIIEQAESPEELEENRIAGDLDLGLTSDAFYGINPEGWNDYGSVRAIDLSTGEVAWRVETPEPERGGPTTTASGLTFIGGGDGVLRAIETETGEVLREFQTGNQIAAAPAIYEANGEQYVAVAIGGTFTSSAGGTASRLDVFALGGSRQQSEPPDTTPGEEEAPGGGAPPAWLSQVDEGTLGLQVVAREGDGGVELNGQREGEMVVTVPAGAEINVAYSNQTGAPGGLAVMPPGGGPPAFPGASTPGGAGGVTGPAPRYFSFTPSQQGTYWIGAPEGAARGERIVLRVAGPDAGATLRSEGLLYALEEGSG